MKHSAYRPGKVIEAASRGDEVALVAALADGGGKDVDPEWLALALTEAALGHAGCLRILIGAGAKIEGLDDCELTPLMHAAQNGHAQCVRTLIDAGASIDLSGRGGWTAAMGAAGENRLECLRMLVEAGADIHRRDAVGQSAATEACASRPDCLSFLLEAGARVEDPDPNGWTLLLHAARGYPECLAMLLSKGANVHVEGSHGRTAAMQAAAVGSVACLELLARAGAPMGKPKLAPQSPLQIAESRGHVGAAQLLRTLVEREALESMDDLSPAKGTGPRRM